MQDRGVVNKDKIGANHDTAASMSHDNAMKYACLVFDEGGVKWTHNPRAPQVKKVLTDGDIDVILLACMSCADEW